MRFAIHDREPYPMDVNRGFTMLLPLAAALCLLNAKARADSLPVGGAAVDRVSHVQCRSPTTFVTLAHPGADADAAKGPARGKTPAIRAIAVRRGRS